MKKTKKEIEERKNFILSRNNPTNDNSDDDVITKCDKQHCGTEGSVEKTAKKDETVVYIAYIYKIAEFSLHYSTPYHVL